MMVSATAPALLRHDAALGSIGEFASGKIATELLFSHRNDAQLVLTGIAEAQPQFVSASTTTLVKPAVSPIPTALPFRCTSNRAVLTLRPARVHSSRATDASPETAAADRDALVHRCRLVPLHKSGGERAWLWAP